jgi:uncharacterized protein involved in outer membrane biogenesis
LRTAARRLTKGILVLLAVLGLAAFALARLVDVDARRDDIAAALSNRTGLDVRITGRLSLSLGWNPGVVVSGIELHPPGRADEPPIARFEAMAFEADVMRSWDEGRIVLRQARASGIEVTLVRGADGIGNWQMPGAAPRLPRRPSPGALRFPLERVLIEDIRLSYETAVSDWAFTLDLSRLEIDAPSARSEVRFSAEGVAQGRTFELDLVTTTTAPPQTALLAPGAELDVEAEGRLGPLDIDAVGRLSDPLGDAQADFAVVLHADDIGDIRKVVRVSEKLRLAGLGPLDVRAQLVGGSGSVRLDGVSAKVGSARYGALEGRGRIGDLVHGGEIDLFLSVDTPAVAAVARRVRIPVPDVRQGSGTARLRGRWPEVRFESIELTAEHRLGDTVTVEGEVARVGKTWAAGIDFRVDAARVGHASEMIEEIAESVRRDGVEVRLGRPERALQQALMAIGPLTARGRVEGEDKTWRLVGLEADAGEGGRDWLRGRGGVASLVPTSTGIDIELDAGTDDFASLSERAGAPVRGLERLRLHGRVLGDGEDLVLTDMQAIASTPDTITMGVSGDLPVADTWRQMQAVVAVSARDLAVLGEVLERPLPALGPVELSAEVHADEDALVAQDIVMGLGESVVTGSLRVEPGLERPRVTAVLVSERLRLEDMGLAPAARSDEASEDDAGAPSWLDRPLPFEDLRVLDGAIGLRIDHLVGLGGFEVNDIRLLTDVENGVLRIEDLALVYQGGRADVSLSMDANARPPELALRLDGDGFDIERVVAQLMTERVATGVGQLVVDLRGRGNTVREIGATVGGDALFYGREGGLAMRYSRALQIDIGRANARRAARGELEPVRCLILDVAAERGVLSFESVLFDTADKQVLGSGEVDLGREQLDLLLTPLLKEALPGSMAAAVRIHGPMDDPRVTPAPLLTASAAAQGLVDRALLPLRSVLPGVGSAVDDLRRSADRAIEGAGVDLPDAGLWRPGIDVTCEKMLQTERIEALRSSGPSIGAAPG